MWTLTHDITCHIKYIRHEAKQTDAHTDVSMDAGIVLVELYEACVCYVSHVIYINCHIHLCFLHLIILQTYQNTVL